MYTMFSMIYENINPVCIYWRNIFPLVYYVYCVFNHVWKYILRLYKLKECTHSGINVLNESILTSLPYRTRNGKLGIFYWRTK